MLTPSASTIVVVRDQSLLDACRHRGINAILMPDGSESVALNNTRIICLDDAEAYNMAADLVGLGIDPVYVDCIDADACPEGCAVALIAQGAEKIEACARDLYFNEIRPLADAKDDPVLRERIPCGLNFLEKHIRWRRRELCVVAGPYGCGKSILMQMLALKWAESGGGADRIMPVWLCTWEDDPLVQKDLILAHYTHGSDCPSPHQVQRAIAMQRKILHTNPELDRSRDLDWYIERARHYSKKCGTNFFVLDPWSEFDHVRGRDQTETEYVKAVMRVLHKLSVELNAIFIVVTHITKAKYAEGNTIRPFRVADAMGSVQFGSTGARGICVLRTSQLIGPNDHLVAHFDKIKTEGATDMGELGTIALRYVRERHEFIHDADASRDAADAWNGRRSQE